MYTEMQICRGLTDKKSRHTQGHYNDLITPLVEGVKFAKTRSTLIELHLALSLTLRRSK